jgi:RimJ/RimL family protein N-acetyltransferase
MNLCFRSILPADSTLLFQWRNDSDTRRNSINTAKVSPEDHARWFRKMMTFDSRWISIAELDGLPVGVIRLDWNKEHDHCEVSFTVAPEHRRKGLGFKIVQQQLEELQGATVLARVKIANAGSRRIFDRLSFHIIGRSGELLLYAKDLTGRLPDSAVSQFQHTEAIRSRIAV